tara:strand:- start:232 stop:459 length:228 start_codon:yes stop_codon:yes gene_type:complete
VREYIAAAIMIVFTSLSFWGMNMFGFQNNPHDVLWAIGAGLAVLIILLINVYIYFVVCKETPWTWKNEESSNQDE